MRSVADNVILIRFLIQNITNFNEKQLRVFFLYIFVPLYIYIYIYIYEL
jgi:hypothetical protein